MIELSTDFGTFVTVRRLAAPESWACSSAMNMMGGWRSSKGRLMWKAYSLGMMVVSGSMTTLLGRLTMSRALEAQGRHCATVSDPVRSVVSFVIIAQTVLEGL